VHKAHHRLGVDRVERAGRLVGEQQLTITDHGTSNRHPLPLATGKLVGVLNSCPAQDPILGRGPLERTREPRS
jgi:hypothetical protein